MAPRAKKAAVKKTTRKPAAKKNTVAKKLPTTPIEEAFTKSQILAHISEEVQLTKKEVAAVFNSLHNLVHRHMRKRGCGEFNFPGLMNLTLKKNPASKARKGTNPFTGEEMMFKAKPARRVVKVRPLKKLKEMAE